MSRAAQLARLYSEIYEEARRRDPELRPRIPVAEALGSKIALVAQALARDTQRLSGYPYTLTMGALSDGGRELDRFLARFGYTIDHRVAARQYAYATDLVHWFPGRDESGTADIVPSPTEIDLCWSWLEQELRLADPLALVALGLPAAKELLSRYAGVRVTRRTPKLRDLVRQCHPVRFNGGQLPLYVVYHPSRAWQFPDAGPVYSWTATEIQTALKNG